MRSRAEVFTVTPEAAHHIKALMGARTPPPLGLRVGVKTRGCSGLAYQLSYADQDDPAAEIIEVNGVKIFIDPKALLYLVGTEMTYESNDLHEGFSFKNPNEKGRCGCGESFHV